MPIGGGDMPTVIALLNSYAGAACAAMGFALDNRLLIIAGALNAVVRLYSLGDHVQGHEPLVRQRAVRRVRAGAGTAPRRKASTKPVHSATAEDAASILASARKVIVVPGYGMAVAQAQHKLRELTDALTKRGVRSAISRFTPSPDACPAT